jgi:hypothetical protein
MNNSTPMILTVPEIQRLIEDLRYAATRPDWATTQQLVDWLATYSEVCEEINVRLRRIGQLLQRGLRIEAITIAEEEPKLLPLVELLDFPELPQLETILRERGMVFPPGLLLDIAQQLNSAYADNLGLSGLLREHRLLALSRAPLNKRLVVLRNLVKADPHNLVWQDDQRTWEQERLRQIQGEAAEAVEYDNFNRLTELAREIQNPEWTLKPGGDIQQFVQRAYSRLQQKQAVQTLEQLLPLLQQARQSGDYDYAVQLASQWEQALQPANLSYDHPLSTEYASIQQWIDQQRTLLEAENQFQQEIFNLEQVLETDAPYLDLVNRYERLTRYNKEIPPTLVRRLQLRLDYLQTRTKRKTRLWVAGIATVVLAVLAGIGWFTYQQIEQGKLKKAVATLDQYLKPPVDFARAELYLKDLEQNQPGIYQSDEISKRRADLTQLIQQEQNRVAELNKIWQQFENQVIEQESALDLFAIEVKRAEKLTVTEDEKVKLAEWEHRFSIKRRELQAKRDDNFRTKLDAIRTQVEEFAKQADDIDPNKFQELATALKTTLQEMATAPRVSKELLDQVRPLQQVVTNRTNEFGVVQQQLADALRWSVQLAAPENYSSELKAYAEKYLGTKRAIDAAKVANETSFWNGAEEWRSFLVDFGMYSPTLTPDEAKQYLTKGDALNEQYPLHQYAIYYPNLRLRFVTVMARVDENNKPIQEQFGKLLRNQIFNNVYLIISNNQHFYLTRTEYEKTKDTNLAFTYIKNESLDTEKFTKAAKQELKYLDKALHAQVATKLESQLTELKPETWDAVFEAMLKECDKLIADLKSQGSQTDPIVAAILIRNILDNGSKGSPTFAAKYKNKFAAFDKDDLDLSVNWLDPLDANLENPRNIARSILLNAYDKAPLASPPAIPTKPPTLPQLLGFIYRDLHDKWQLQTTQLKPRQANLYIFHQDNLKSMIKAEKIGVIQDNTITIENRSEILLEGRPVYSLPTMSPTSPGK